MKECPTCNHCFEDTLNWCTTDGKALVTSLHGSTLMSGRYQLEYRLGQGGMGAVYKARHTLLKTDCAIKVISRKLGGNDTHLLKRFHQEAVVAASIRHPNIVLVTDYGVAEGDIPFLVMEYIKGHSLADLMKNRGRFSLMEALEIMEPVAAGVGAAHRRGIVHRDLKPLNIMMQSGLPLSQGIKILDFGLAKIKSEELFGSMAMAETIGLMGSPLYMAPEQWSEEAPDRFADIYSLGIIMYQLLTGHVPFQGESMPSVMRMHLMEAPPAFAAEGLPIPPRVEKIVARALEKNPAARPQSTEEFIREFREAVEGTSRPELDHSQPTAEAFTAVLPAEPPGIRGADTVYSVSLSHDQIAPIMSGLEVSRETVEAERLLQQVEEAQQRADQARRQLTEAKERAEQARQLAEKEAARKRAEVEANRLAREAQVAHDQAKEAQKRAEEEAQRRAEEFAARKRAEDEVARLGREIAEANQRLAVERENAGAEAKRVADAARQEALGLVLRKQQEAEALKEAEAQAARRMAMEESARQRAEAEARRLAAEAKEAQRLAEEGRNQAAAEAQRRAEAEAARQRAEAEVNRLAQEVADAQRRVDEVQSRAEAEAQRRQESVQTIHQSEADGHALRTSIGDHGVSTTSIADASNPWKSASLAQGLSSTSPEQDAAFHADRRAALDQLNASLGYNAPAPPRPSPVRYIVIAAATVVVVLLGVFAAYKFFVPRSGTENANTDPGKKAQPGDDRLVALARGTFLMGNDTVDPDGETTWTQYPAHEESVRSFLIYQTEVSMAEYGEFLRATKHPAPADWGGTAPPRGKENLPVVNVSYLDAVEFSRWRSDQWGRQCRLPTETEWEYAARSGSFNYFYPWGNDWQDGAENIGTSGPRPVGASEVGTKVGGVKDMLGNVIEWTGTKPAAYPGYSGKREIGNDASNKFIVRGGAFGDKAGDNTLLTRRSWLAPDKTSDRLGFRIVCEK